MSWIEKLYRTYEANSTRDRNEAQPLEPICHTTQKAHITIVIDGSGSFLRCSLVPKVPKSEAKTLVPATEESAGRAGNKPVNHPLCDKLQYVAGDLADFGGDVTAGYSDDPDEPHRDYLKQLSEWCNSPYRHPTASAILEYVRKRSVVADLINAGLLHAEEDARVPAKVRLLNQWPDKKSIPGIFKLLPGGVDSKGKKKPWQAHAFVRWSVEVPGQEQSDVWTNEDLWRSWAEYYGSREAVKGLCYVTGEQQAFLAKQHPRNIRGGGDKGKLISSNDKSGYTFRGRFTSADEACGVSFEVTQKAHNALRWLIARQGYRDGDQAIVAWAVSGEEVPDPYLDTYELALGLRGSNAGESDDNESGDNQEESKQGGGYTAQEIGIQFAKRVAGYAAKLGDTTDVVVMALDSATQGRIAITFYRELTGSELLERVETWHKECCWHQRFPDKADSRKINEFHGAPAPRDIAEAAYGKVKDDKKEEAKKKLCKATVERLLPCIVDGAPIPRDLVESCVRRASSRQSFKWEWDKARGYVSWEWEKALGIACALYRYQHKERSYSMALERDRRTRDYLYGRLLALAERLEGFALYVAGEERETNAGRLMQRFAMRPFTTWLDIETKLTPYRTRLRTRNPGFLHNIEVEMDEVNSLFVSPENYADDRPLSGEFLLAYHCQRHKLWEKAKCDKCGGTFNRKEMHSGLVCDDCYEGPNSEEESQEKER